LCSKVRCTRANIVSGSTAQTWLLFIGCLYP
jgi:hypothetical protein